MANYSIKGRNQKKRRCCFIRQGHYPACVRLRKEVLAMAEKGYEVDIICLKGKYQKKYEVSEGINLYRLSLNRSRKDKWTYLYEYVFFFFHAMIKLFALYIRKRYDFIQINTLPDFLVFVTLVPKIFGAKIILDLHEPSPELFCLLFGAKSKAFINAVKFFEKISIWYADRVITVSEQMKKNYMRRGATAGKINVVLNVPNLEFNADLYKRDKININKKFILICHGAILKRYGQNIVIRAIKIVKNKVPDIQLNILGFGDYEKELKKLTAQLNLNNFVRFYGYLPYLEMIQKIADSDLGVVPVEKNPYSDLVHTNKMFELIAMKRPVIASRTCAVEEFFGFDDSCLKYFESGNEKDLANCIIELYNYPEKRKKMVENAFKKYQAVRWEITKNEYCRIYEKLLR